MKKVHCSQLAGMNLHYLNNPLEYFLDSLVKFDIQSVKLWGGAPHILNQIRAVVGS